MTSDAAGLQLTQDTSCNFSVMEYKQIYAISVMRCKKPQATVSLAASAERARFAAIQTHDLPGKFRWVHAYRSTLLNFIVLLLPCTDSCLVTACAH